ncbi:FadR/GntR family transcriptional regulator [Bradyrhizobium sp. LTSP885]|uniref:FadR/GntR family transcriptional regulator n=1 Tax=Bradyrhizobium sp. LTSP885 TaxID=1619232 RepID=UPI0005C80DF9|nr:FadR/GntR family transcriptional regulator [Bradyrhizobium sp. LTSP885]
MFQTSNVLRRNVHSQVTDRVGGSIVRGEIGIGETLPPEMQICEMMDVSRTVVREAIRTLTGKGLIESRPKSGTRVRPAEQWNQLDPDVLRWHLETSDMDQYLAKLFQLRTAVEPAAAALAAVQASEEDIARIRAGCDGMDAAEINEEFVVADIAFHQAIYFATRNEFFWPIAQMFEITLRQSFAIAATGSHRPRALIEHRAVLDAIAAGDADAARETTVVLLAHSADDLVRIRGREFETTAPRPARKR